MSRLRLHPEHHLVGRIGWLRAAVLGANDGIVSTASLIVGVAAAATTPNAVLIAGVAGLVAGAMSMAAGEYVSVSSQSDTERADLARERKELSDNVEFEREELTEIYVKRGLEPYLSRQVAQQLMAKDALTAHARDELGISEITTARPVQAALTSAATFSVGAAMPLLMVVITPPGGGCSDSVRCVSGVSRPSRCDRGKSRWCKCSARDSSSDILGGFGDGTYRRYWEDFRNSCLTTKTSFTLDIKVFLCHVSSGRLDMHCATGLFSMAFVAALATNAAAADARKGETLAKRWCATCHVVAADQQVGTTQSPAFSTIARNSDFNEATLALFLLNPHPRMPDMNLSRSEAADLAAYIKTQK